MAWLIYQISGLLTPWFWRIYICEEFLSYMGMAAIFVVQPKPKRQLTLSYLNGSTIIGHVSTENKKCHKHMTNAPKGIGLA